MTLNHQLPRVVLTEGATRDEQTTLELLADVEHELRVYGYPVWLGSATRKHESHLQVSACRREFAAIPLAGRSYHRITHTAHHRIDERSHLESSGKASPILPGGSNPGQLGALCDAQ